MYGGIVYVYIKKENPHTIEKVPESNSFRDFL